MRRKLLTKGISLLVLTILVISACAPAAAPSPAAPAPAPKAPAQPAAPAPAAAPAVPAPAATPTSVGAPAPAPTKLTPKRGGTVTLTTNVAGAILDPYLNSTQGLKVLGCCYLKLLRAERGTQLYDATYKPQLAERWDIAPDGKSITFHLRKGVKWAPLPPLNGREVTAEDVKYSYDRFAFNPQSLVRGAFVNLASVEVVDKYTVKFVGTQPSALLIENAQQHPAWIIPKEIVEKEGNISSTIIGAGPFYLEKAVKGVGFTLARNDNYYDAPKPYPDKVKWIQVIDKAAQMAAFRAGELDVLGAMRKPDLDALLKTNPQSKVDRSLQGGVYWFIFKADEPNSPWADKRVRVAMSKALDRDAMVASLYYGEGDWGGAIPAGYAPYGLTMEEKRKLPNLQYDLAAAKSLMKEAGYPNGFKVTLYYASKNFNVDPNIIMGANMLKENLNVDMDLSKGSEYTEWLADGFTGKAKQVIYITMGGTSLWWQILQFQYYSKGKWHTSQINSAELDKRIEDIFTTFDAKEQVKKTKDIQYYILNDLLYWIPLPGGAAYALQQPWLQDFNEVATDYSYYSDFWISK